MQNQIRTGRMLDINALTSSKTKVTLGFKCEPQLKMDLAFEAERFSMSLSEYVEVLVARRHQNCSDTELKRQIEHLKKQLEFYENRRLLKFFEKYKGQTVQFVDQSGNENKLLIETPQHVYHYLLQSIKL